MRKDKRIAIRLSEDEYKHIMQKAQNHGLTISRYLRDLSMNYPITCIVDQILDLQILLKEQAKRIIQNDNQKDSKQKAE
ncbi:hypothetical protein CRL82_07895 [Campylobacter coli]|nr:hypothetical protein [Campylobacter coli]EAI9658640.1 hypothetical protein [Campylobacter coli]EAI9663997.1 hypothetical protein [Campylobacter coli]EAJ3965863.1 hypothetical protein [Campylobacter coli]EAJ3986922.1 hypothetical protein [Campylobacter coli]